MLFAVLGIGLMELHVSNAHRNAHHASAVLLARDASKATLFRMMLVRVVASLAHLHV